MDSHQASEAQASHPTSQPQPTSPSKEIMPAFFIGHAGPALAIDKNEYVDFLRAFHKTIAPPKAIVIFSAHWESPVQMIGNVTKHGTMYDFGNHHPPEMFKLLYNAPGSPAIANQVKSLFEQNGIRSEFEERDLDHGIWTILIHLFPEADIPVIALSVDPDLTAEQHYKIGAALKPLKEEGVLIIGSGATVHNLDKVEQGGEPTPDPWAIEFDLWLEKQVMEWEKQELFEYMEKGPHAKLAAPTPEHFVPFILAAGAGDLSQKPVLMHRSYQSGNLSRNTYNFH